MGKINVLDFEIANLIAAGEVVERPSSVLKELIENSIDSGADKIVAEIKRGGVSLIRVTDNGCGMTAEDLPVAIKRHATSKISSREDLEAITTLGFRGEALAAISSVSKVTIISCPKGQDTGNMLISEGGKIIDISEVGASDGTTVVVEDLFYNVPARRKFLKKDATEALNVAALVEKVALSRPDIAIQLLIDGNERFSTPGNGDLYDTIYSVFGKAFAEKMIKVEGTANSIRVHGFIGRSDNIRKNRNLENIFINGRYVKSLTAQAAVEKAYTSYIAPEGFPVCVLFLEMHPSMVDVNVHPAKLEVKFAGEQPVFEAVYHTVRSAIEEQEYRPELELSSGRKNDRNPLGAFVPIGENTRGEQISISTKTASPSISYSDFSKRESPASVQSDPSQDVVFRASSGISAAPQTIQNEKKYSFIGSYVNGGSASSSGANGNRQSSDCMSPKASVELLEKYSRTTAAFDNKTEEKTKLIEKNGQNDNTVDTEKGYTIIGEAFNCYIFVECDGELLVIDKHAAHERIIFEELKSTRAADGRIASQSLMLPITVLMSGDSYSAAVDNASELQKTGFEFEPLDGHINITAIPASVSSADAEELFVRMTDELAEGRGNPEITESIRQEKALYQIACKAAIKGGRVYDSSITDWLVSKLLSIPDITVCPHGRPVAFKLKKTELDRRFDRLK